MSLPDLLKKLLYAALDIIQNQIEIFLFPIIIDNNTAIEIYKNGMPTSFQVKMVNDLTTLHANYICNRITVLEQVQPTSQITSSSQ